MSSTETARSEYIAGLRALADHLEATPDLPLPTERTVSWAAHVIAETPEQERVVIATLARLLPGKLDKNDPTENSYTANYFILSGRLHGLKLEAWAERPKVCRRVVKGVREVTEEVPAPDAPTVTVIKTVEDVEWVCEPLLAEAMSR